MYFRLIRRVCRRIIKRFLEWKRRSNRMTMKISKLISTIFKVKPGNYWAQKLNLNSTVKLKKGDAPWQRLCCWKVQKKSSSNRQKSNTEVHRSSYILAKRMEASRNKQQVPLSPHSSFLEDRGLEGSLRTVVVHGKFSLWSIARRSTSALFSLRNKLRVSMTKLSYSSKGWKQRPTSLTLVTNC